VRIPFGTGSYKLGDGVEFSAQRMVNCYLEQAPPGSEVEFYVRQSWGIDDWATPGTGVLRGGNIVRGVLYVVIGTTAWRITNTGASASLGTVPGTGRVVIRGDETNVVFLAGRVMYEWDGSTFSQVSDADAPSTDWLENMDGYYIGSDANTGQFKISSNRDVQVWDALDFASAEDYPDDIVTGIVDHGELLLFGTESGEGFYNSGNSDFPLERVPSAQWEIGIAGVDALCKYDNGVAFVGADYVIYRLNGYIPQRISEHTIESRLRNATDKDFRLFSWTEAGHKFLAVTCADFTFVYDVSTQLWHERQSYGYAHWRPLFVLNVYEKMLVGDSRSNKIGELTPDAATEWGDVLRSSGTCPPITSDNKATEHNRLELIFESGVGTLATTNPQVMLRFSDNRGRTWSNEKWRSLGAQGQYNKRAVWHALGLANSRIYEWAISDPVRRTLIGATLETERGEY
jgi:hypothetical protein